MSTIENVHEEYRKLIEGLNQQRDELRVQMHLASMEVKDEWAEMEKKWQHMTAKSKQVGEVVDDTAEDVLELLIDLGHEIRDGYKRIKKVI